MRVKQRRVARAIGQLEAIGLNQHVIVLSTGKHTKEQRRRVQDKAKIRTPQIIKAIRWLCDNHSAWRDVDYDKILEELSQTVPVFVDNSEEVESENANIEEQ